MSEKSSEYQMAVLLECQGMLRKLAEPCPAGDSVKAAINRAARRLRWPYSRVKSIWYADTRVRVHADEYAALQRAAKIQAEEADGREEFRELVERLERTVELLRQTDPELYRTHIDALLAQAGRMEREG